MKIREEMSPIIQLTPSTSPDPLNALHLTMLQCLFEAFSDKKVLSLSSSSNGPGGTRSVLFMKTSKDAPASFSAFNNSTTHTQ